MRKRDIILAFISGILLILSFPPFDFFLLALIALVPLLIALSDKDYRASFLLGTITGFIYFVGTIYWVFNSMYFYGHIPAIISLFLMIALCLYLGIYTGIFSLIFNHLSYRSRFPALLLVPVIWVTLEVLRTYAFTGFPWGLLGYSQYKFLILIQIADITGVYGISFIVASINGAIFDLVLHWPKKQRRMPLFGRWPLTIGLFSLAAVMAFVIFYGMWELRKDNNGQVMKVSVIQGNIEQEQKWESKFQRKIMDVYKMLTIKAVKDSPQLIIWPETAVPFIFGKDEPFTEDLKEFQKTLNTPLLFGGVLVKNVRDNKYQLSNSAILLSDGNVLSMYDKIHLVPYGEYVPLRKILPFIEKLVIGIGDFIPGERYTVMDSPPARLSTPICYEIIFPGMVRKFVNNSANLIVTITNDAWFGRTSAPYQHFSMAVLRAVENRVPVARAANTGISGFIDMKGRIRKKSAIFVEAVLTENINIGSLKKSFYSKYGDLFAFSCIVGFVLLVANNLGSNKR